MQNCVQNIPNNMRKTNVAFLKGKGGEGLASILEVACDKCMKSFHIESFPKTAGYKKIKLEHHGQLF